MSAPQVPKKYPSVNLAYPLAVQSYDLMVKRIDAMEARIHSTIGLLVSLTFAIPVALKAFDLQYRQGWMVATGVMFLLAILLSIVARLFGTISLVSPKELNKTWIQYPEDHFKQQFVLRAGEHADANVSLLNTRHKLLCGAIFLSLLEALSFGVAVLGPPERAEPDQVGLAVLAEQVVAESVRAQQVVAESALAEQVLAVVDPALMDFHQIAGRHYLLILPSCTNATPPGMARQARWRDGFQSACGSMRPSAAEAVDFPAALRKVVEEEQGG